MHELSIAMSIVAVVEEEAAGLTAECVKRVFVKVGALSGVVEDALQFSYALASAGTSLDGTTLVIERVPILVFCPTCRTESPVVSMQQMHCAECGTAGGDIVQGRELLVTGLELRAVEHVR